MLAVLTLAGLVVWSHLDESSLTRLSDRLGVPIAIVLGLVVPVEIYLWRTPDSRSRQTSRMAAAKATRRGLGSETSATSSADTTTYWTNMADTKKDRIAVSLSAQASGLPVGTSVPVSFNVGHRLVDRSETTNFSEAYRTLDRAALWSVLMFLSLLMAAAGSGFALRYGEPQSSPPVLTTEILLPGRAALSLLLSPGALLLSVWCWLRIWELQDDLEWSPLQNWQVRLPLVVGGVSATVCAFVALPVGRAGPVGVLFDARWEASGGAALAWGGAVVAALSWLYLFSVMLFSGMRMREPLLRRRATRGTWVAVAAAAVVSVGAVIAVFASPGV